VGRTNSQPSSRSICRSGTPSWAPSRRPPAWSSKTHLAIRACQAGHRVLFATAAQWVARLAEAHRAGRLQTELTRLGRYSLLVFRRSRLHPLWSQSRQPVLPACLRPRAESCAQP